MPAVNNDIYSRNSASFGGVFTSDRMIISLGRDIPAALMQSTNFNYAQTISKFYELSSANIYLIGGRTNGNATMSHIIGPKQVLSPFFQKYGDVCKARTNNIDMSLFAEDCDVTNFRQGATRLGAKICVMMNITIGTTAENGIINANSQLMFSSLELVEG